MAFSRVMLGKNELLLEACQKLLAQTVIAGRVLIVWSNARLARGDAAIDAQFERTPDMLRSPGKVHCQDRHAH